MTEVVINYKTFRFTTEQLAALNNILKLAECKDCNDKTWGKFGVTIQSIQTSRWSDES